MRGFGAPQALFAAEQQMDRLAEKLGLDPITIRLRNCLREGSLLATQTEVPKGVSVAQVIERCAEAAGYTREGERWKKPSLPPGRGIGFACGFKNVGYSFGFPEGCTATIELHGGAEICCATRRRRWGKARTPRWRRWPLRRWECRWKKSGW